MEPAALLRKETLGAPGGLTVAAYGFRQPRRLSTSDRRRWQRPASCREPEASCAGSLPFSVVPVDYPRHDGRMLDDKSEPNADSFFKNYTWTLVGANTPCGTAHLGWRFRHTESADEFLGLIVRPERAWAVGNAPRKESRSRVSLRQLGLDPRAADAAAAAASPEALVDAMASESAED